MKVFCALLGALCLSQLVVSQKIVCYWGTWANYRNGGDGNGKFEVSSIDTSLCTHLNYAFFGITDQGDFKSLDSWLDLDSGLGFVSKTVGLKKTNPKLKVLAAVGGWAEGSAKYSRMAADPAKRARFISTTLSFIRQHGFDGLDLDWEYPAQREGSPADKANFVTLLKEIKQALSQYGLELSIAVGAGAQTVSASYDVAGIAPHVDFINVMTYDFAMASDGILGYNAPLPKIQDAINNWLQKGAPASKLILGIPFYGRTFKLANTGQTTPGSPSSGAGNKGPYTAEDGYLGYNEICLNKDWTVVFDSANGVPYTYKGDQWVGYDNVESINLKVNFAKSKNLGGAMIWSIETDDFRGKCGEKYPLLKAINRAYNGGSIPPPSLTPSPVPSSTLSPSPSPTSAPSGNCNADGLYANANDCSRYYQCYSGVRYDFQCANGLYFDSSISNCNWISLVKCSV